MTNTLVDQDSTATSRTMMTPWLGIRRSGGPPPREGAFGGSVFFIEKDGDSSPILSGDSVRLRGTGESRRPAFPLEDAQTTDSFVIVKVPRINSPGPEIRLSDYVRITSTVDVPAREPEAFAWSPANSMDKVFIVPLSMRRFDGASAQEPGVRA